MELISCMHLQLHLVHHAWLRDSCLTWLWWTGLNYWTGLVDWRTSGLD